MSELIAQAVEGDGTAGCCERLTVKTATLAKAYLIGAEEATAQSALEDEFVAVHCSRGEDLSTPEGRGAACVGRCGVRKG